jgi:hypothetical protein
VLLVFNSLGTPPNSRRSRNTSTPRRCRNCSSPPAPPNGTIRRTSPGHGLAAQLQSETADLRQVRPEETTERQDRHRSFQNDDYGKDYLKGFKVGLGAKAASMIVIEESYEVSEPTIDSHIVKLKSTGADVFFNITTPKFAAQAIKKNAEIGWKTAALPQQRLGIDRQRHEAGRLREWHRTSSRRNTSRIRPTRNGRTIRHEGRNDSWKVLSGSPTAPTRR